MYYNYALSVNGKRVKHGTTYPTDYLTDVIVSVYMCYSVTLANIGTKLHVCIKHSVDFLE